VGDLTVEFFCRAPEETLGKKINYFAEREEKKRSAKSLCRAEFCRVHFAERHVKKRSAKSLPSVFGPLPSVKTLGKVPVSSSDVTELNRMNPLIFPLSVGMRSAESLLIKGQLSYQISSQMIHGSEMSAYYITTQTSVLAYFCLFLFLFNHCSFPEPKISVTNLYEGLCVSMGEKVLCSY